MANNISIKDAAAATVVTKTTDNASVHTAHVNVDSGTITTVTTVTNLSQMGGVAISLNTGVRDTGTQRVTIATDDAIILGAGTAEVGKLAAGSAVIGEVTIGAATGAAGDLAKLEDAVHGSGDVGIMALAVRNDTLAALADTDGDYAPIQVDANGAIYVVPSAGAAQSVDDTTTHTAATTEQVNVGFVAVPTDTLVDANDIGMAGMSTDRRLWTDSDIQVAGTPLSVGGGTEANALRVTIANDSTGVATVDTNGSAYQFSIAPTVTAGAYTAGDVIGTGELVITNAARVSGGGGILTGISMHEEGVATVVSTIDVLIFSTEPAGSTFTDNGALTVVDADGPFLVCAVLLDTLTNIGGATLLQKLNINVAYKCAGTSLYAVPVHRGTWAPAATDGMTFNFQMIRD